MENKGKIIVIEGIYDSGKNTQTKLLVERLNKENIKCVSFSFPCYDTPTGKIIGGPYLGKKGATEGFFDSCMDLDPKIACLYYAADRKYNIGKVEKYLNDGYYVILERYVTSNLAHQGGKITDPDKRFYMYQWIDKLEYWLLELPKPDITIFLYLPYNYTKNLAKKHEFVNDYEKKPELLINVEKSYLELCELYNWNKIECIRDNKLRSIEDINDEIFNIVVK